MRITICTSGRFHVADLARELIGLGHDVVFHSIVPKRRLEGFGIPRSNQRCYLGWVLPFLFAQRKLKLQPSFNQRLDRQTMRILDARFSRIAQPGEVFIGMSGLCLKSLLAAKEKGSKILLERGSRHILSQKQILENIEKPGTASVSPWTIKRELRGYDIADTIVVGSMHVEESFLNRQTDSSRLFRNPYGVNLEEFQPTRLSDAPFDVIMVGLWCRRKGSDMLAEVVLNKLGLTLLHVGPVGDIELPKNDRFQHVEPVAQNMLPQYYSQARIFAMPSHEEGLAMVQAQALACGLPVAGSTRSGAQDLAKLTRLGRPIITAITPGNENELALAIDAALSWSRKHQMVVRDLLENKREELSWKAYGERYSDYLNQKCKN